MSIVPPPKKGSHSQPVETMVYQKGQQLQKKRLRDRVDKKRHLAFYDRGPGAAGYLLPPLVGKRDHDVRYVIAPEYSMRPFLHSSFQQEGLVGPGTGYYKIPDNVTHHGKFYPIEKSFGQKELASVVDDRLTPSSHYYKLAYLGTDSEKSKVGPGSHDMPGPDVYLFRTGKCLILPFRPLRGRRYTDALYILESMLGPKIVSRLAAQETSMKGTRKEEKKGDTGPGPGTYTLSDFERKPAWTMLGRQRPPSDMMSAVGPKYSMENIKNGPRAPAWKLGQKANDFTGILRTACDVVDYKNLDRLN